MTADYRSPLIPLSCWFAPREDGHKLQFTPPPVQAQQPAPGFVDVCILKIEHGQPVEAWLADGFKLVLTPRITAVRCNPHERTPGGHPVYQIDAELVPHLEPVMSMHVPEGIRPS